MTALNTYRRWLARVEDDALRAELSALDEVRDAAQIEDRFYRDLAFGTGGLRGVLGARAEGGLRRARRHRGQRQPAQELDGAGL